MSAASRERFGWTLYESGPEHADHTVLLLPGALATAVFYDDLLADRRLEGVSIRFVATTLPGFGGTPAPADVSMENYARVAGQIADELGCAAVVGHSLGANVPVEMAAEEPSRVTWEIQPQEDGTTLLTVVHDKLEGAPKTAASVSGTGWMFVLSNLKTFLETGKPLSG